MIKKIWNSLFAKDINFKVRIFNLLAFTGIVVILVIFVASVIHGTSFLNCATLLVTAVLATALLVYSIKTHRYMQCYLMTVVLVFILLFPVLFFTAGGYHSGMPCFFVFAFVFTMFMLEGKTGIIFTVLEMVLYFACCMIAYFYPNLVSAYPDERGVLVDVVISFVVSGLALNAAFFFLIRMYNNQQRMLEEATRAAESSNEAKSRFLSQMSHEIRTPINAVVGMNEVILRECEDENILEYANNIEIASQNLLSIINDILDFSKIESGNMEIFENEYKLGELLNDVVTMIELKVKQKGLQFEISVSRELPDTLVGDDVRIKQILLNLLNNAVKYTHKGTVRLEVTGEIDAEEKEVLLQVAVKDTGIGIREEDISALFEGFRRLDLEKNRNIEGTGLGLAITHSLAKMMGGKVEVESVYGEGSVFTLQLAQRIVGHGHVGDFAKNTGRNVGHAHKYENTFIAPEASVLVVDDNLLNLKVVQNLLKKTQMQITTCMSGIEALELMCQKRYDVILLDHMMPEPDGIETLRRSKQMPDNRNIDVAVIALTANAVSGAREMYLAEGFTDYMSKPIVRNRLEEKLAKYIPSEKLIFMQENEEDEKSMTTADRDETDKLIDFETGMKYCADSEDIYFEILEMFCAQHDEKYTELQRLLEEEDWNNYTILIHSLKSNALNVGSRRLSEACLQLELAGKSIRAGESVQEKTAYILNNHAAAMQLYDDVIKVVKEYFEEKGKI